MQRHNQYMILAVLAGCIGSACNRDTEDEPMNLLMISIDTLRRDHIGRYGGDISTPFIDSFLAEGMAFDSHRTCSNWTYPSVLCMMSGQSGVELGWLPTGDEFTYDAFIPNDTMLPYILSQNGTQSWMTNSNRFVGSTSGLDGLYDVVWEERGGTAEEVVANGLRFFNQMDENIDERWFVHLHFLDPHSGYNPPESYLTGLDGLDPIDIDLTEQDPVNDINRAWSSYSEKEQALIEEHIRIRYEGEIRYLDDQLSLFWETLEEQGLLENTVVVLWSDHGEQLFEHGSLTHGVALFRGEVDAIAGIVGPGISPTAITDPTTHADLAPTILDLLGLDIPSAMTGLKLNEPLPSRPLFAERRHSSDHIQSVLFENRELIFDWKTSTLEMYDLATDPDEMTDLFELGSTEAADLWVHLEPRVQMMAEIVGEEPDWPALK